MANSPNDPWDDAQVEQLVRFDEALRLGRDADDEARPLNPQVDQAQQFLRRVQAVWQRTPRKIGPYIIVRTLGQGSIGPCYLVEEPDTHQPFVLKILWPDLSAQAQARKYLLREAKALRIYRHANVAGFLEARLAGASCYVVSEYCPGPSLAQWRRTRPQPLAWEVVVHSIARLANTLETAHHQGIVHGNLKPTNLFLPAEVEVTPENLSDQTIRIADVGLAKSIHQARLPAQSGLPWPMPQYLAPEQLSQRRRPAEPASDLYALGVLIYELLTGRAPVQGTTREEILTHTRDTSPPSPRQYCSEIPAELAALVLACLHKNPHERPASAQHLADDLRALLPVAQPAWWKQWLGWM